MDVANYLARINYNGSLKPDLKTLTDLTWAHKTAVPFTNLEFMSNNGKVDFDLNKIYQKVVIENRGGVCFQINRLYVWLLKQLGFQVSMLRGSIIFDPTKGWSDWGVHNFVFVSTVFHRFCFFVVVVN